MTVHLIVILDSTTQQRHTSLHSTLANANETVVHELVSGSFRQRPATQVAISETYSQYLTQPDVLFSHLQHIADNAYLTVWHDEVALPESLQYETL